MDMEVKATGDDEKLNYRTVIHIRCGKKHVDSDKFATFNHRKHLCHNCNTYFYDTERGIGV